MHWYVEGGGDTKKLRIACREGFARFLEKAGLKGHMPHIAAYGGRAATYDAFCTALRQKKGAMLLVDSEESVDFRYAQGESKDWHPWLYLAQRDGWPQPKGAEDLACHLMVQCMENWFLADRETLHVFFGQGYEVKKLPAVGNPIESVAKETLYKALADATRHCKTKAPYGKGEHSFQLLAKIDPAKVTAVSPWAARFMTTLKQVMGC
ncbi:MAG: DUF4276 family protein [Magnetococcales bacterium]|nr:DUF4276 family protein [Magnetococcales bacterium]